MKAWNRHNQLCVRNVERGGIAAEIAIPAKMSVGDKTTVLSKTTVTFIHPLSDFSRLQ